MNTFFHKIFNSAAGFLIAIHFIGAIISFVVLSYQHVADRGFMALFSLEMNVPALKSLVWEVFLVRELSEKSGQEDAVTFPAHIEWWQPEYPTLVRAVSDADSSRLSASFRTGPDGSSEVYLSLFKDERNGMVLKMQLPKEALFSIDPRTGEKKESEVTSEITIRDYNMDG